MWLQYGCQKERIGDLLLLKRFHVQEKLSNKLLNNLPIDKLALKKVTLMDFKEILRRKNHQFLG